LFSVSSQFADKEAARFRLIVTTPSILSSAHAQRKDQKVKAAAAGLPELRAIYALSQKNPTVQWSCRPVHF
jgi:hypothetical protein